MTSSLRTALTLEEVATLAAVAGRSCTDVKTRLDLKPGQRGTKKLSELYGDQLVCVRYRYDEKIGKRYKA